MVSRYVMLGVLAAALVLGAAACEKREHPSPQPPSGTGAEAEQSPVSSLEQEAGPAASPASAAGGSIEVGQTAPSWTLKDLDGKAIGLNDFRGKKGVVMVFFATWCSYCMAEVPHLIDFTERFKDRPIEVIGVALEQPARVIRRFAEKKKVNYRLLLDSDGSVARAYGVVGIPMLVGIDASGTIRFIGHRLPQDAPRLVEQLAEGAGAEPQPLQAKQEKPS